MPAKLYMFYLGGHAGQANIELHDIQFVACNTVEEAIPALKAAWFGDASQVHIDGFICLQWADGYVIDLVREAPDNSRMQLYFVNMGGYIPGQLAEVHDFGLFVAPSAEAAKEKAKTRLLRGLDARHKDNLHAIDHCLLLARVNGWYVRLTPHSHRQPNVLQWQGYRPI